MTVTLKSKDGQAIRKLIPLTTLSEAAFNKLCSQIRIEEGPKGTVLFKQGDQKNEFVYLLEGTISLQAAGMEMDTISGGSEEARFALAHQIPRKVFAVAKDKIRFIRVNAEILNSTTSKQRDSVSYEVTDIPEESSGDWMTTLLKSPIFQRLPAANLQKVLTGMEEIEVKAGELIVKQGEPGDYYYIIKKGRCSLTRKPSKNAKEIKLAELKTTDTFGEDSLISGATRNVNITMLTDGIVLRLSKENFLELVKKPVIQTVSIDQAIHAAAKGAVLLDVRTPDSFEHGHLEDSRNIPFFSLRMQIASLDPAKKLIVVCEDGTTSEAASFLLIRYAFDAIVLDGGLNAVPEQYLATLNRNSKPAAAQPSREIAEPTSIELAADEKQALDEARQIISQLQTQLQAEQEKRTTAEQDHGKSHASQETVSKNELELRKQIEVLNREFEMAKKEVQDYRNRLAEAQNKLASTNQASAKANRESDNLKSELSAMLKSLESELNNRQAELEKALNRSADDKKRIESLGETLKDQEKRLRELNTSVREKNSKLEKEISAKSVIEANLSRIQKETSSQVAILGEQADKAKQTITEVQQQLEQSRQSCALLAKQKNELAESQSGKVESLLGEKQTFEKEAADLKHRVEQIVDEKQRMESEAKQRIDQLQENLERLEQQIAEKNHDFVAMEEKLCAIRKENAALDHRIEGFQNSATDFAENTSQLVELQSEIHRLKEQRQTVLDEKNKLLDEVTSLRKENSDMESLIRKLTEQVEQGGVDETIDSLQTELGMVREQAENDVKMMKERLDRSHMTVNRLEQALTAERRRVAELEESSCRPLSLNPALTAVDSDVFDMVEEEETKPGNSKQSSNSQSSSIGKFIAASILSGVASLAGSGGFLLGTESGRDWLESFLRADSPIRFLSQSKHSTSSEREHPNSTPPDDVQGIDAAQRQLQTGTGDFEAGRSTSFNVELEPDQTIRPEDPGQ